MTLRRNARKGQNQTDLVEKSLFVSDVHFPHHSETALNLMFEFSRWLKPAKIFVVGDILDFYQLSRFNKNPRRKQSLQNEIDLGRAFFQKLRAHHPNAEIDFLEGNHEHRLERFMCDNPAFAHLKDLQLSHLLRLKKYKISHYPYRTILNYGNILIEHGDKVNDKSAYTAAAMMDKRQVSGVSGHTHRLGMHYKRDVTGTKTWVENGCLCSLEPEYVTGPPDWQHGFTVGYRLNNENVVNLEQIHIANSRIVYAGKVWHGS